MYGFGLIASYSSTKWRTFTPTPGVPLPPALPVVTSILAADTDADRSVALPQGAYYLVIDNSQDVGQVSPPPATPFFDPVARGSYLISMGDAP